MDKTWLNTEILLTAEDPFSRLFQQLFADGETSSVFALIDGASVERLPELLDSSGLIYSSLFAGNLTEELARVAPYLVELEKDNFLTQRFLCQWGSHWGVILASTIDFVELAIHFQKLLLVRGPEGKRLYFRFYDPRVLRKYLPSCQSSELSQFFGPCHTFYVETEGGKGCEIFSIATERIAHPKNITEV